MATRAKETVLADLQEQRRALARVEAEIAEREQSKKILEEEIIKLANELARVSARLAGTPLEGFCGIRKDDRTIEVFEVANSVLPCIFGSCRAEREGLAVTYESPAPTERHGKTPAVVYGMGYDHHDVIGFGKTGALIVGVVGQQEVKYLVAYGHTEEEVRALLAAA